MQTMRAGRAAPGAVPGVAPRAVPGLAAWGPSDSNNGRASVTPAERRKKRRWIRGRGWFMEHLSAEALPHVRAAWITGAFGGRFRLTGTTVAGWRASPP